MSVVKRCQGVTKSGSQCQNRVQDDSDYCYIHRVVREQSTINGQQSTINGSLLAGYSMDEPTDETPIVEAMAEPDTLDLVREYVGRLSKVVGDLKANLGGTMPNFVEKLPIPPDILQNTVNRFLPDPDSGTVMGELRKAIEEEGLDREALQGIWYMAQFSLQYQADMAKRRFTGDYDVDEWGADWEFIETIRPLLSFLYGTYWRVEATGLENIPDYGRGLIVANHSGQLPFDAGMIMTAVLTEHESQRLVRNLYANWFPTLPFVSNLFEKLGQTMANEENGVRLLEQEELVGVYPEGYKGVSKLFKNRYQLARFGRGGFVQMALKTGSPIIPTAVVGAEETYISLGQSKGLAKLTGFPYFPVTPRFPWLGPLGVIPLPTKWSIDFGKPIPMDDFPANAPDNIVLVTQLTEMVRTNIQEMIYRRLAARESVFFG